MTVVLMRGLAVAQSVQDLGFPKAAVVEVVFPTVVFGNSPIGRVTTEIVVVNQTDRDVYVEGDLYDSDGLVPRLPVGFNGVGTNTFSGVYRGSLSANSIAVVAYVPATLGDLVGPPFSGWALVRANGPITVYERIKVADPDSLEPPFEFNLNGNNRPVQEAEFPVKLTTRPFPSRNSGISVVNPDESKGLNLQIELLDDARNALQSRVLALPPRGHRALIVNEFFTTSIASGFVRIRSEAGGFAFTALDFAVYQANQRQRPLLTFQFPATLNRLTGQKLTSIRYGSDSWNLIETVGSTARIGDLEIILSNFGFFLRSDDGVRVGPFSVLEPRPEISVNEAAGIAVVAGPSQQRPLSKPIVFAKQRKVVYELMHGNVAQILDLPSKSQAEIKTESLVSVGLTAQVATWVLVDTNRAEVIGRFVATAPDQLPPWR
ncbi:MAG: hypothetical protein HYX74_06485 [Acidobacteria bacterium]|nr:hypothetical protein [Acidobacteriota bacterium]